MGEMAVPDVQTSGYTDGRSGTILHAADLHLGAPLKALSLRVAPEVAAQIRETATRAFANLVTLAIDADVDVVVLSGDVYDSAEFEIAAQMRFVTGLRRLTDKGIRVFIAHGNHDPLTSAFRPAAKMPDGVTVFTPGQPQVHPVTLRDGHVVHIAGVSFGNQSEPDNLAKLFVDLGTPTSATVGVLHCNVGGQVEHGPYAPCSTDDLTSAPVGYWALGHIHKRDVQPMGPGRWWAYPGNLQGRSAKPAECGDKGVLLVPVMHDGFGEPEFRRCADVRFERRRVDVTACEDIDEVVSAVVADVEALAQDVPSVVARVELVGQTVVHRQLTTTGSAKVLELVHERLDLTATTAVTKIELSTSPPFDRQQALDRNDLLSALLTRFDESSDHHSLVMETCVEVEAPMRNRLCELMESDPELARRITKRAEQLLIDRLEDAS